LLILTLKCTEDDTKAEDLEVVVHTVEEVIEDHMDEIDIIDGIAADDRMIETILIIWIPIEMTWNDYMIKTTMKGHTTDEIEEDHILEDIILTEDAETVVAHMID